MSNLSVFDFNSNKVRVLVVNEAPWFVAKDLCDVLELSDVSRTCSRLDDDEKGTHTIRTPGGDQSLIIVSESGMYSLVLTSRKPEAKAFKKWITSEVLVSIRKTGQYSSPGLILNQGWLTRNIEYKKKTKIPYDYFSIFGELTCGLISDFETAGYQLPTSSHIDISVGLCWSNHIKAKIGDSKVNSLRKLYDHHYPDGRVVKAYIYHNSLLPDFREWMELLYKKEPLNKYLKKNDPRALTYLSEFLQLALLPG